MTKTAIIIGFHYSSSKHYISLNGALTDVYGVHKHCELCGFNVICIGDFCYEEFVSEKCLDDKHVNRDVYEFCKLNDIERVHSFLSFKNAIQSALNDVKEELLVYFSGHGDSSQSKMILPDNSKLEWREFFRWIIEGARDSDDICFVIDCCYPPSFGLTHKLVNGAWVIDSLYDDVHNGVETLDWDGAKNPEIYGPNILLIASSETKSHASDIGSLFTRIIFGHVLFDVSTTGVCVSLESLRTHINKLVESRTHSHMTTQTISIRSSTGFNMHLPMWMCSDD